MAVVRQYQEVSFVSGGVGNIEIIHKSAGKGSALLKLGELLGIGRTEIMAVGDSENDLDMIEKSGLGCGDGQRRGGCQSPCRCAYRI